MLLVDDILLLPFRGIFGAFREVHNAALQERHNEAQAITAELSELYIMLDTGKIAETEFEAREKELLDRLDEIQQRERQIEEGNEEDETYKDESTLEE